MIRTLTLLAAFGFASIATADNHLAKYEGTYVIVAGERDGKAIPGNEIDGSIVVFKGDTITGSDKDKKMFFGCKFDVDAKASPNQIMMISTAPKSGDKAAGVIEMTGNTIRLCYALPGGETPVDFKAKEKQQCFTLKKKE